MDALLVYIERYKFAILGTVLIHVAVFVYANLTTIEKPYKIVETQVELSIPLEDIEFDPEIIEALKLTENMPTEEVLNMAADENDQREKSYEDFSTQEMDNFDETDAKALEKQYFEEWGATHDSKDNKNSNADIIDKDKVDKNKNNINKNNIKTDGSNAIAGAVMVSFNLKNRKAHSLPKPGYTCNSAGTVVVDIKVDGNGDVKSAVYNSSRSNGADNCMVSKALKYAKKSRFNFSSGTGTQSGTITYKFVSK